MVRVRPEVWDPSGYKLMWLFALFDLPVVDPDERKQYARFRKFLLSQGFCMLQFSVYARHCASEESGEGIKAAVRRAVPPDGQVRLLLVTDKQFAKQEVYIGNRRKPSEEPPTQLMLF